MSTSRVQKLFVNSALQFYKKHSNSNLHFSGSNNFHKKAITLSDKCVTTFFYYLQNHLKIGKICFCWFRFQQTLFSSLWKQVYLVILKAFFIMFVCSRWLWSLAAILLRTGVGGPNPFVEKNIFSSFEHNGQNLTMKNHQRGWIS